MKRILLIGAMACIAMTSSPGFGWTETAPTQKQYSFKFKFKATTFEYSRTAPSYEEAYESAAQACFTHYKGKRKIAESEGLDIIDVCANPRS